HLTGKKNQNGGGTKLFVADQGGRIIGMLVADIRRTKERTGYITNLIVAPDFRNKGVGEQLISGAMDFFKQEHVTTIKVNIRSDTMQVRALFAKLGFQEHVIQLKKII
nr:GNAT family N-acetyltransferase [Candidatus Sigynarchaeota archaeon]